jgi:CRP-like cAMP-binding protein
MKEPQMSDPSKYVNILKQVDIFDTLSQDQLEMIGNLCQEKTFEADDTIFLESTKSDELYLIAEGEVDIQVDPALVSDNINEKSSFATIATLRRGQSFGEISLVDNGLRSATARAKQNKTRLLIIPRDGLMSLCEMHPRLGYRLMYNLATDLSLKMRTRNFLFRDALILGKSK